MDTDKATGEQALMQFWFGLIYDAYKEDYKTCFNSCHLYHF